MPIILQIYFYNMNYFTFAELTCTKEDTINVPISMEHVENLCTLCHFLNQIREEFGEPIIVNSAFRTPIVNHAVGGDSNSFHLKGRAADIRPEYGRDFYSELERLNRIIVKYSDDIEEFILHQTFTHIAI